MRIRSILLCVLLTSCSLRADIIRLKNGRSVYAERVRERGARVEYELGDNTYAIPKSLVERIDAGGVPPEYSTASGPAKSTEPAPVPAVNLELQIANDIYALVLHDGQVDTESLQKLEHTGTPDNAAAGYFLAAQHELSRKNLASARTYLEKANSLRPDNPVLLTHYAGVLMRSGAASQALVQAERAAHLAPNSPDALALLGAAQYANDKLDIAIATWKRALALRNDASVRQLLARAERDRDAQTGYLENQSSHFVLHYEGKQASETFRRALLETLDTEYRDLTAAFNTAPRDAIVVILYTNQAFFDVTQAPGWTVAVNDGKVRIPVSGLDSVTPELARVLKHELAHSFITYASHGRAPQWLQEGLAQLVEGKSLQSRGSRLAQLFQADQHIPFNMLETSFMNFSAPEAIVAYDESLAAVEYIHATYGMSDLQRILQRLSEGSATEAALRSTIHAGYREFEAEIGKYLASQYGA